MAWNLDETIEYYRSMGAPGDQNALIALLREIQREEGSIPAHILGDLAGKLGTKESLILAIIRRIPSLRLSNTHTLELCGGPNCGKHRDLAEYAEKLQKKHGSFTLKFIPCQRMCGKGPNIRWDGKLYHGATRELLERLTGERG